jgi:hypothetical protein
VPVFGPKQNNQQELNEMKQVAAYAGPMAITCSAFWLSTWQTKTGTIHTSLETVALGVLHGVSVRAI